MRKRAFGSSVIVFIIAHPTTRTFMPLIKIQVGLSLSLSPFVRVGFVSDGARGSTFKTSRINRSLNKARNPDYFVSSRHSVLDEPTVYNLSTILPSLVPRERRTVMYRGGRKSEPVSKRRQGERDDLTKWKNSALLTYALTIGLVGS